MKALRKSMALGGIALAALTSLCIAQDCAEGCTPGYWKNHPERWDGAGNDDFTNTIQHQLNFNSVLNVTQAQSGKADTVSLLQAASTGGGGLDALGRHAAAALASADTNILYSIDVATVISLYRDAVGADLGAESVSSVHQFLVLANEAGCPLSNNYVGSTICTFCYADEGDCPADNEFIGGGGCTNSTGSGAILTASGSSKYIADDLVLTASNLPANTPVIWIQAPATSRVPLRDGLLCLAPGGLKIIRVATQASSANGVAVLGPGIIQISIDNPVVVAEILPGATWNFQAYYRDTASTTGGMANLTNAAQVMF
jgi:hypothetical protein